MANQIQPGDFLTVAQFVRQFPNFGTEASLRWQIFCAEQNGLAEAGAIVRRGRRVFLVVPRYVACMTGEQRDKAA